MPCFLEVFWWWATFWQIWRNMLRIILSSKLNFLIYWIFLALWLFLVLVCWALYSSISLLGKMAFHHCSFSWFCLQATVSISLNHFHHLIFYPYVHTLRLPNRPLSNWKRNQVFLFCSMWCLRFISFVFDLYKLNIPFLISFSTLNP